MKHKDLKKSNFLFIILLLSPCFSYAQTVRDWYWPKGNFNQMTYYMPNATTGKPTTATRISYYAQIGYLRKTKNKVHREITDFEITDVQLMNNQPGLIEKKSIEFVGNEVRIKKKTIKLVDDENEKTTVFSPTQTIFKLPLKGRSESWLYNGLKYTSSWTTMLTDGDKIEAIKVVQYSPKWNNSTVQYYIEGYGLVETIVTSEKSNIILDKFHQRLFNEDLYTDDLSRNTKFNYLKSENIFTDPLERSYEDSQFYFYLNEPTKKISNNFNSHTKPKIENSLSLITTYEKLVINNEEPNLEGVQTKYDDKDYRVIIWNDKLYNKTLYNNKSLKDLGYDYIGITQDDSRHITYSYRNCEKNLTLELTEWYDLKLSIFVSWFSDVVKNSSGKFIGCSSSNN